MGRHRTRTAAVMRGTSAFQRALAAYPANAYKLSYWRGKWEESYVSWSKKSSLSFDEAGYFLFGSRMAEALVMFAVAGLVIGCAWLSWATREA